MQKVCISIDGINGVGKTTLINKLIKMYPHVGFVELPYSERLHNFEWWFNDSSPEELIHEIYRILEERYKTIQQHNHSIVVVDKGILTLEARLYATFRMRDIESDEIKRLLNLFRAMCMSFESIPVYSVLLMHKYVEIFDTEFFAEYNAIQEQYINTQRYSCYIDAQNVNEAICILTDYVKSLLFDFSKVKLLAIDNLLAPYEYTYVAKRVYKYMLDNWSDHIRLIALVGSSYFGSVRKGWSDIDFLVVVNNKEAKKEIEKIVFTEKVHIGISCFLVEELFLDSLDIKSKWNIYYIQNDLVHPLYVNNLVGPYIEANHLRAIENMKLKEILFALDRYSNTGLADTKNIVKKVIIALKIYLNKKGFIVKDSCEVFNLAKSIFQLDIMQDKLFSQDKEYLMNLARVVVEIYDQIA